MRWLDRRLLLAAFLTASVTVGSQAEYRPTGETRSAADAGGRPAHAEEAGEPLQTAPADAGQAMRRTAIVPFATQRPGGANSEATTSSQATTSEPASGHSAVEGPAEPQQQPLPLARPNQRPAHRRRAGQPPTAGRAITTVLGSLAVVLGLFFVVVWCARRALPKASTSLPQEVVEVLGRAPLGHRQHMHLVRIGNKLVLLSVTPSGAETLTEITDPAQVDRIAGICRQHQPGSITATFRQVLTHFGSEPAPGGLLGADPAGDPDRADASGAPAKPPLETVGA